MVFECVFLDVQLRHDFFGGFSFQIGSVDDALGRRQAGALGGEIGALLIKRPDSRLSNAVIISFLRQTVPTVVAGCHLFVQRIHRL